MRTVPYLRHRRCLRTSRSSRRLREAVNGADSYEGSTAGTQYTASPVGLGGVAGHWLAGRGINSRCCCLTAAGADPHRQSSQQDPLKSGFIGLFAIGARVGSPPDIDDKLNSSFGELNGFTDLQPHLTFIRESVAPEPAAFILLGGWR